MGQAHAQIQVLLTASSPATLQMMHLLWRAVPFNSALSLLQALLHPYLFSPPLPAHHSELPLPTNSRWYQASEPFDVLAPIEKSILKPELLAPHMSTFSMSSSNIALP